MAESYIGNRLSITSKSNIRYEGLLVAVDVNAGTLSLSNVRSFGSENRQVARFVPPGNDVYGQVTFKGSEILELTVISAPPPDFVDPAILGQSQPTPTPVAQPPAQPTQPPAQPAQPPAQPAQPSPPKQQPPQHHQQQASHHHQQHHHQGYKPQAQSKPFTRDSANPWGRPPTGPTNPEGKDFDFVASTSQLSKEQLEEEFKDLKIDQKTIYDPQKSFFDTLSHNAGASDGPKKTFIEERAQNMETFGVAGTYQRGRGGRGGPRGRGFRGGYNSNYNNNNNNNNYGGQGHFNAGGNDAQSGSNGSSYPRGGYRGGSNNYRGGYNSYPQSQQNFSSNDGQQRGGYRGGYRGARGGWRGRGGQGEDRAAPSTQPSS